MTSHNNTIIIKLLNDAIKLEHSAWYFYNYVSSIFYKYAYKHLSKKFQNEASEELEHAQKVIKFMNQLNYHVEFFQIDNISVDLYSSNQLIIKVFEHAVALEITVLDHYKKIKYEAEKINNFEISNFVDEFIELQIGEIKNFKDNLENAKRCWDTQLGEFIFDNSLK